MSCSIRAPRFRPSGGPHELRDLGALALVHPGYRLSSSSSRLRDERARDPRRRMWPYDSAPALRRAGPQPDPFGDLGRLLPECGKACPALRRTGSRRVRRRGAVGADDDVVDDADRRAQLRRLERAAIPCRTRRCAGIRRGGRRRTAWRRAWAEEAGEDVDQGLFLPCSRRVGSGGADSAPLDGGRHPASARTRPNRAPDLRELEEGRSPRSLPQASSCASDRTPCAGDPAREHDHQHCDQHAVEEEPIRGDRLGVDGDVLRDECACECAPAA